MKSLYSIIAVVFLCSSTYASDIMATKIEEKDFVCFDVDTSKILLQQSINYPKLNLELGLLEQQMETIREQLKVKDDLIVIKEKEFTVVSNLAADLQHRVDSANAWYKSPYLWTAVGFVVGVGVSIGIYYAVEN